MFHFIYLLVIYSLYLSRFRKSNKNVKYIFFSFLNKNIAPNMSQIHNNKKEYVSVSLVFIYILQDFSALLSLRPQPNEWFTPSQLLQVKIFLIDGLKQSGSWETNLMFCISKNKYASNLCLKNNQLSSPKKTPKIKIAQDKMIKKSPW